VARPSWLKYLGRGDHPALDRLLDSLANGGLDESHVGSRLLRFIAVAGPTPADTAIRIGDSRSAPTALRAESIVVVPAATEPEVPAGPDHDPLDPTVRHQSGAVPTAVVATVPDDGNQMRLDSPATVLSPVPDPVLSDPRADPQAVPTLFENVEQPSFRMDGVGPEGTRFGTAQYVAVFTDSFTAGYVYDTANMQLLPGGPGDYPELFGDGGSRMMLSGDYSAGVTLDAAPGAIESIELMAGNSYNLVAPDALVQRGQVLSVSAATLGEQDHFLFEGSAESDGSYFILGSGGGDTIIGGGGNDRIVGRGGGDLLAGGGGRDTFAYFGASDSTGSNYDTLGGFDAASDKIDLVGTVAGFHAPVESGSLSLATFNTDLAAALGGLGASQAAWFAPDAGDLAGQIFLIVDANGVAGYQEGEDYVFAVSGTPLIDLSGHTDIFV